MKCVRDEWHVRVFKNQNLKSNAYFHVAVHELQYITSWGKRMTQFFV